MINEHDITKSMIEKIKSIRFINEVEDTKREIVLLANGTETNVDASLSDFWGQDKEAFMQQVTPNVTFDSFVIIPKSGSNPGNVKMVGKFDNGISFDMNKSEQLGLVINANNVKLDDDTYKIITTLFKYYDNWRKDWAIKLNTENFGNV